MSVKYLAPALLGLLLASGAAVAYPYNYGYVNGNDTGGIIPWSPETRLAARAMATEHCAQFGKLPRLTGVDARYGGYISFACRFDRRVVRYLYY